MNDKETAVSTDRLTHAAFSENVRTKFRVRVGAEKSVDLDLVEVSEQKISERQERFAIVFRGPIDAFVPQGLYTFEHERMGVLDLFIVPIGRDERGFSYEAVFNRLRPAN